MPVKIAPVISGSAGLLIRHIGDGNVEVGDGGMALSLRGTGVTVQGSAFSNLGFYGLSPAVARPAAPIDLATTIAALQTLGLVGT